MPDRVGASLTGARPVPGRQDAQQADQAQQAAAGAGQNNAQPGTIDRVEISAAAQERSQQQATAGGQAQQTNAQETRHTQPNGGQDTLNRVAQENATRLRKQQQAAANQQTANPQNRQPGNLIDVTG